jgi:hypothetical protein
MVTLRVPAAVVALLAGVVAARADWRPDDLITMRIGRSVSPRRRRRSPSSAAMASCV